MVLQIDVRAPARKHSTECKLSANIARFNTVSQESPVSFSDMMVFSQHLSIEYRFDFRPRLNYFTLCFLAQT